MEDVKYKHNLVAFQSVSSGDNLKPRSFFTLQAEELAQPLRARTYSCRDSSSIPGNYVVWLTITCASGK